MAGEANKPNYSRVQKWVALYTALQNNNFYLIIYLMKYFPKIYRMMRMLLIMPFRVDIITTLRFLYVTIINIPQIIKNKNFNVPYKKMHGKLCIFKFCGKKIILDGISFGYAGEIYLRKCYTPPTFTIKENDTVIDLGASVGPFSIAAALLGANVIAVDISQKSLRKLKEQAKLNNCLNKIKIVFGAVGLHGSMGIYVNQIKEAPILELNQLIKENNISVIDFLKIDIEGSEFDLLKNNNNWLKKVKKIAMEVHPSCGNPKELKDILEQNGFKCFFRNLNNKIVKSITGPDGEYLFANKTNN